MLPPCEFCSSTSYINHTVREMMFGTRDEFIYRECSNCGCLRIAEVPSDLSRHYREGYIGRGASDKNGLWLFARNSLVFAGMTAAASYALICRFCYLPIVEVAHLLGLNRSQKILDVGAGNGLWVSDLRRSGFNAVGIDPCIPDDISDHRGVAVWRKELADVSSGWDAIAFNHSLEHIPEQIGTLALAASKLKPGGFLAIRIPIAASTWKEYGTNWIGLDAPRHLVIHTEHSFRLAAHKAGLEISKVVYDSTFFGFWGSELYRRDMPFCDNQDPSRLFSRPQLQEFHRKSRELNCSSQGDQACFFLTPRCPNVPQG
jgi:2-polyprenyl-3-methyl-5-hydroxy-6-metoxy-1,4-benzoquinol methylase